MSIFRDTFDKTIASSISKRQDAMINRTPENIQYLNSRNSWIRMTSAVNVNGTNTLASQYVLQGGTLNSDSTLKSGIGNSSNDSYSTVSPSGKTHKFGIRPMPGISSLDIKSKTAYGSLREATVKFHCWDMTQLEDIELLYMRPGYTVLVEWGWLPYIDSGGKYHPTFNNFYSDTLLNFKAGSKTREQIFKELYQKSIDYSGNYDARYGYVKNYEWSAREDGGYDCTTTIISTGEIIESLKMNYVRADLKKLKMYDSGSKGDGYLNPLFNKQGTTPSTKFADYYQKNTLAGIWAELNYKLKDPEAEVKFTGFTVSSFPGLTNYGDFDTFIQPGSGLKVYINLESTFEILNKYAIAQSEGEPLIKLSTKAESYSKKGKDDEKNKENDLLCVSHPLQVSIDPTVCLINSPLWYEKVAPAISGSADIVSTIIANSLNQTSTPPATTGVTPTGTTPTTPTTPPPSPPTAQDKDTAKKAYDLIIFAVARIGTIEDQLRNGLQLITNRQIFDEVQILLSNHSDPAFGSLQKVFNEEIDSDDFDFSVTCRDILLKAGIDTIFEVRVSPKTGNPYIKKINEIDVNALKTEKAILKVKTKSFKLTYPNVTSTTPTSTFTAVGGTVVANTATAAPTEDPTATTTTTSTVLFSVTDAIASLQNLEKLKGFFYKDEPNRELGTIGNIYVSLDFLYRQALSQNLESGDSKEKGEINLYGYIKSIMSGIQTALGSVNNFEIHVDPIDNIARVIDVNYTTPNKPSNLFELQVHKTNSTVRSYKLQSQIFPSQTTIVSTASQTRGGQIGIQNNTMIDYNKNITDRIIQKKQDPSSNAIINKENLEEDKEGNNLASILAGVVLLFGFLGAKPTENAPSTVNIGELVSKAKSAMRDLIVYFQTLQSKSPGRNRNIIPTKFSFEMDGIGGLIVGSLFRINKDILPTGYKGEGIGTELAKVITEINHRISNGDWTTEINTQTFILDRPEFGTFGSFNIVPLIKKSLEQIIKEKVGFPPPPPIYVANNFNAGGGGGPIADPGNVGSDLNLFFYLVWQQGPSGAAQHYSLYKRNGKITRYSISAKNIKSNWPGSSHGATAGNKSSKGYSVADIDTLYNSGRHQELAEAFVEVWRQKFIDKASTGLQLINSNGKDRTGTPYSTIRAVFEKYGPSSGIAVSTLATFGYIENGLNPDTNPSKKFQGPFQMDSTNYYANEIRSAKKLGTNSKNGFIIYDWDDITRLAIPRMVSGFAEFKNKSGFIG